MKIMKTKNLLYGVLTSIVMLLTACTPDSDSMGAIDLTTAQLAENTGFSVNVDQNTIRLHLQVCSPVAILFTGSMVLLLLLMMSVSQVLVPTTSIR